MVGVGVDSSTSLKIAFWILLSEWLHLLSICPQNPDWESLSVFKAACSSDLVHPLSLQLSARTGIARCQI